MQSFNSLSPKYRYYFWHSVPNSGLTKFCNGLSTCRQLSSTKVDGAQLTSLASLSFWEFTSVYCTTQIRQPVARVHPRYFYIRSPALIANSRVCDCTVEHWHRLAAGTLPSPVTPPPLPLWHQSRSREQWRDSVPILCTPPRTANFVAYSRVRDLNNARVYNVHTAKWPVAWWRNS